MLTDKELQVLLLRKQGLLQKEIAERLGVHQSVVSRLETNAQQKVADALADLALLDAASIDYARRSQEPSVRLKAIRETLGVKR